MTSRDFCFWLQGFIEITGTDHGVHNEPTHAQWMKIRQHLDLVFKHDIGKTTVVAHDPSPTSTISSSSILGALKDYKGIDPSEFIC